MLHGDEVRTINNAQIKNLGDIAVVELNRDLGFIHKHGDEFLISGDVGQDTFDRQAYDRVLGPEKLKLENALKRGFEDFDDGGIADPNF